MKRAKKKKALGTGKKKKLSFPRSFATFCNRKKKVTNSCCGCGRSVILFCCIKDLNEDRFFFLEMFITEGNQLCASSYALSESVCQCALEMRINFGSLVCKVWHLTFRCFQQLGNMQPLLTVEIGGPALNFTRKAAASGFSKSVLFRWFWKGGGLKTVRRCHSLRLARKTAEYFHLHAAAAVFWRPSLRISKTRLIVPRSLSFGEVVLNRPIALVFLWSTGRKRSLFTHLSGFGGNARFYCYLMCAAHLDSLKLGGALCTLTVVTKYTTNTHDCKADWQRHNGSNTLNGTGQFMAQNLPFFF